MANGDGRNDVETSNGSSVSSAPPSAATPAPASITVTITITIVLIMILFRIICIICIIIVIIIIIRGGLGSHHRSMPPLPPRVGEQPRQPAYTETVYMFTHVAAAACVEVLFHVCVCVCEYVSRMYTETMYMFAYVTITVSHTCITHVYICVRRYLCYTHVSRMHNLLHRCVSFEHVYTETEKGVCTGLG